MSPQGRKAGIERNRTEALAALTTVEVNVIKPLDERAQSIEMALLGKVSLKPPTDPAERIAHDLRLQEIRSQLRELPATERLNVYLTTSDAMTLATIEDAPMTLSERRPDGSRRLEPLIDPEQRTTAALERAKQRTPRW